MPPVVRTLIYAQDPGRVQAWVDRVAARWEFEQIVPAHWAAPIKASPRDFTRSLSLSLTHLPPLPLSPQNPLNSIPLNLHPTIYTLHVKLNRRLNLKHQGFCLPA